MGVFLRGFKLSFLFFSLVSLTAGDLFATPAFPRPASVPEGLGFNIHFFDPLPGEMKMLADSGVRWVRMDLMWHVTEGKDGQYDFSGPDRLLAALAPHKIRVLFILSYGNPLHDQGKPPFSEEGRRAFARWVAAAVKHFQGKGIIWEMWNEPNLGLFWGPKPSVEDYIRLALEVGKAIQNTAPGEIYAGPALSKLNKNDLKFLEACFKGGLLNYWSTVTVHPYRKKDPETVSGDYQKLEELIGRYAPDDRAIPVLSGEWGYSTRWRGIDDEKQGKYLPRQWLTNLMHHIPLSIWYDWRDDGMNPKNDEHHYGSVFHAHHPDRDPPFDPKPSYKAAKTLTETLSGFHFAKRLAVGGPDDYVLLFKKGEELRLAAWTRSKETRKLLIPADSGLFKAVDHTGEVERTYLSTSQGLCLPLRDGPQYLIAPPSTDLLQEATAWTPRYEHQIRGREKECLVNPLK